MGCARVALWSPWRRTAALVACSAALSFGTAMAGQEQDAKEGGQNEQPEALSQQPLCQEQSQLSHWWEERWVPTSRRTEWSENQWWRDSSGGSNTPST